MSSKLFFSIVINLLSLRSLLKKGKSKSWETLAEEIFNITEISTAPLLAYYKPLEEFLDIGGKFENKTPLIDPDSFKLFFKTSSLDSTPEKEKEGGRLQRANYTLN